MGLFNRLKDPVLGTAKVVSATAAPHNATSGNCRMNLVIEAPGIPAFAAEESKICRVARWPQPGMVLPCEVDRSRPDRFDVDVKSIPDWRDQARQQAEMLAQMANRPGQPGAMPGVFGATTVHVAGTFSAEDAAAALRQAETTIGMDLDGDGGVGTVDASRIQGAAPMTAPPGAPPAAASPSAASQDVLAQLERLVALRDSGALTETEFAVQKARILGGG